MTNLTKLKTVLTILTKKRPVIAGLGGSIHILKEVIADMENKARKKKKKSDWVPSMLDGKDDGYMADWKQ